MQMLLTQLCMEFPGMLIQECFFTEKIEKKKKKIFLTEYGMHMLFTQLCMEFPGMLIQECFFTEKIFSQKQDITMRRVLGMNFMIALRKLKIIIRKILLSCFLPMNGS